MSQFRRCCRAALGLLAAFSLGAPAWAVPSAWTVIGTNPALSVAFLNEQDAAASTAFATTLGGNACASGSLMVVWVRHTVAAIPVTSVTDTAGNTYSLVDQQTTAPGTVFAYSPGITGLTGANSVTVNTGATSGNESVALACVTGAQTSSPLDRSGNNVTGSGSTLSTSTGGVLSQANEIIFGGVAMVGGSAVSSNCNGSFTRLTGGGSITKMLCEQIVSATTSVSFAPSWTNSQTYAGSVITFKGW